MTDMGPDSREGQVGGETYDYTGSSGRPVGYKVNRDQIRNYVANNYAVLLFTFCVCIVYNYVLLLKAQEQTRQTLSLCSGCKLQYQDGIGMKYLANTSNATPSRKYVINK